MFQYTLTQTTISALVFHVIFKVDENRKTLTTELHKFHSQQEATYLF
jgi:hypothetical protein